jgi:2'-5' RNA ligase
MPGRRLFVAVPIADDAATAVAELVGRLRAERDDATGDRRRRDVRWVRLDGLHLTLRFLGPTEEDRVPFVAAAVRDVAASHAPFSLTIDGGGAFPDERRPRALWLGVTDGTAHLAALAEALDRELVAAGWPPSDRPYRAHLTLARSDGVPAGADVARRLITAARGIALRSMVDRVVLYESRTGGGPARYEPLEVAPLGGS